MTGRLVLLGSVLVDLVLEVPRLPPRGGDVLARASLATAGGGFNVLSAAARLGLPATLAGPVGTGPFADIVRAALSAEGIIEALPAAAAADTGYCLVLVEPDGERSFVTVPGAESRLAAADLAGLEVTSDEAVYVSGYDLLYPVNGPVLADFVSALPAGPLVVFDPGPLVADIPAERWRAVLRRTDLLSLSAREAALRHFDAEAAVVVRRGAAGATVRQPGAEPVDVPGVPVRAVDTTGAGDVHVAATVAALASGADLVAATAFANRAAAYAVTRRGPATGPTRAELATFRADG